MQRSRGKNSVMIINSFRILLFTLVLILFTSCAKTETPTPLDIAPTPTVDVSAESVYTFPETIGFKGEVDTDDFINKMHIYVKYINRSITLQSTFKRMDLLYFAVEYLYDSASTTWLENNDSAEAGPEFFIPAKTLAECLHAVFSVAPEYLDRFKDENYQFLSEYDYYDAETDSFYFKATDAKWLNGTFYELSYFDTKINIGDEYVDVRTVLTAPDGKNFLAEYVFLPLTLNEELFFRFVSSNIYEDERILTLDGVDFYAPWSTEVIDGETVYQYMSEGDNGFETWSRPYPWLSRQSGDTVNDSIGICKYFM